MKKISVDYINDLVWAGNWSGPIDPTALKERIEELLKAEDTLSELQEKIRILKDFFK